MKEQQLIIESLLFVASEPLLQSDVSRVFDGHDVPSLDEVVNDINIKYSNHAFEIKAVGEGYMLVSKKEFEPFISKYIPTKKLMLSNASLEVLAIVAYRQPVSRVDIESIRGVDCKGVLKNLLNKKLIKIGGRDDSLGKALLYHTTDEYLKHFGLTSLSEMPTSSEISEIIDSEDNGITNEVI